MIVCYRCAKAITGKVTLTNPSNLQRQFGVMPKAFHPRCYQHEEAEAERELRGTTSTKSPRA